MRSNFLAHWTGKDLAGGVAARAKSPRDITLEPPQEQAFVDRLRGILTDGGFWMTTPPEEIRGALTARVRYQVPMTCFTEVRLSQALEHAKQFGLLGVVVERRFVLERFGGPVFYLRNGEEERIIARTTDIGSVLQQLGQPTPGLPDPMTAFHFLVSFMKSMSSEGTDDFKYLDEHEWRLVFTQEQAALGRLSRTGTQRPFAKVELQPNDVKAIVFPTAGTREMAMRDEAIRNFFSLGMRPPVLLTIEECAEF